jgi:hypothetical protein
MPLQTFKLSPSQWCEFDTYEGRFQIETMSEERITIICDNILIVPSRFKDSLLPEYFDKKENIYPVIDRAQLTFSGVSYLRLRGTLYDIHTKQWIKGSDNTEIVLAHIWGAPDRTKFVYTLEGIGRLEWPPISTDEFVIEASDHLTLTFDDASYFPTGSRRHDLSEQVGTGQPATRPVFEPQSSEQPQPEAEGRCQ